MNILNLDFDFNNISEIFKKKDHTQDIFDELYDYQILSVPPTSPNDNIITDNLNIHYSINDLLITSPLNKKQYKCPTHNSHDAQNIWISAKIPNYSTIYNIELLLLNWAFTYASLEISDNKIISIKWNTNNSKCQSTWKCFIRWIICASTSN